ncbi:hypothetical protein [Trichocoleus sp. FACHB-591]|nr:hypothetical protein [Trichocoleus sp. FACHB-591]
MTFLRLFTESASANWRGFIRNIAELNPVSPQATTGELGEKPNWN